MYSALVQGGPLLRYARGDPFKDGLFRGQVLREGPFETNREVWSANNGQKRSALKVAWGDAVHYHSSQLCSLVTMNDQACKANLMGIPSRGVRAV